METHGDLKQKARQWLELFGYLTKEEVWIGNRRVDVFGEKRGCISIGIECGNIHNCSPSPSNHIVLFHLPYNATKPRRWEPVGKRSTPQRREPSCKEITVAEFCRKLGLSREDPDFDKKLSKVVDEMAANGVISQEVYRQELFWRKCINMVDQSPEEEKDGS